MKALNVEEIDTLVGSLQYLLGSRLHEAIVSSREVGLGFWGEAGLAWLWVDLDPKRPLALPLPKAQSASLKPAKPLLLFLRAHFLGRTLISVKRSQSLGRAIELEFHSDQEELRSIEIRLWPHGQNVICHSGTLNLSLKKIIEPSSPGEEQKKYPGDFLALPLRSVEDLISEYLNRVPKKNRGGGKSKDYDERLKNLIKKTQSAKEKVEEELARKADLAWRDIGQWLVENQSLKVKLGWQPLIDTNRSLAWNIERAFAKTKENERKIEGTKLRLGRLNQELEKLKAVEDPIAFFSLSNKLNPRDQGRRKKTLSRHRTLELKENVRAFVGRSGKDNLELLRHAQPWDYWLHLADFPGAHGFIMRSRSQKIDDADFKRVGHWLVSETFGAKARTREGESFKLLVAECRHVRPIKADKLGRVSYQKSRTLIFRFETRIHAPHKASLP